MGLFGITFRQRGFSPLYSQGSAVKRRFWSPLHNAWNQFKTLLARAKDRDGTRLTAKAHTWPDGSSRMLSFEQAGKPSYGHGTLVLPSGISPGNPCIITDRQLTLLRKPTRTATDKALDRQLGIVRKQRRLAAPKKKK